MKKITPLFFILFFHFLPAHSQSWLLTGNSGSDPNTNFVGTTDDKALVFRSRNIFSGTIDSAQHRTYFGYSAGKTEGADGNDNTGFGYFALGATLDGSGNSAFGSNALAVNSGGVWNTAVGYQSMRNSVNGQSNTAVGVLSLNKISGSSNTAIGVSSMSASLGAFENTAIGRSSMYSNTTGNYNTATGYDCLGNMTTGSYNTANGYMAMLGVNTGIWNTAVGTYSMQSIPAGNYNTAVGGYALRTLANAQYNTAVGYYAGANFTLGYNNVFLGANTKTNSNNYFNVVALGQDATCTASNQARVGNTSTTSIGGYVGWSNISDGRFKKDVTEDVKGLDFILKLRPVNYHLDVPGLSKVLGENSNREGDITSGKAIADKEKMSYTGFIAQEVEAIAQKLNFDFSGVDKPKNEKDLYGLRYAEFVVPLVKAVQEQQQQIDEMKKEIELLKQQNLLLAKLAK